MLLSCKHGPGAPHPRRSPPPSPGRSSSLFPPRFARDPPFPPQASVRWAVSGAEAIAARLPPDTRCPLAPQGILGTTLLPPCFPRQQPHCCFPGDWGTPWGWGCLGGPVLPRPRFPRLWLCARGLSRSRGPPNPPSCCSPGPGAAPPVPSLPPGVEKVSQICRNRSGGGGCVSAAALMSPLHIPQVLRRCHSPGAAVPTAALPLTRARRGDNAKIFPLPAPPPHPVPRVPGAGRARGGRVRGTAWCTLHGARCCSRHPAPRTWGWESWQRFGGAALGTPHPCHTCIPAPSLLGTGEAVGRP